jgi:hypothetical protein
VDVWFVKVDRKPGPPYGKAYGHYKNHKHDRKHSVVLTDADIRHLMAVRMIHEYYGVSAEVAMEWRSSGRDLRVIMTQEYGQRHGNKHAAKADKSDKPGKDNGKGHKNH